MQFPDSLRVPLRGIRLVIAALSLSPLMLVVLRFVLGSGKHASVGGILAMVGVAMATAGLALRPLVRAKLAAHGRRTMREGRFQPGAGMSPAQWEKAVAELGDTARFFTLYQSTTIIPAGMMEMGMVLCGAGYFVGGPIWAAGACAGFVVLQLVLHWPSEQGFLDWHEEQQRLLRDGS